MSSNVLRLYGGNPSDDPNIYLVSINGKNQGTTETLVVGTKRRMILGPKSNAHVSIHVIVDGVGGAGSAMTVWYSNLPSPSVASDSDWVQDTNVGTIDLTVSGGKFFNLGNINPEWIMLKAVVAVSSANVRAFFKIEGTTHGKTG